MNLYSTIGNRAEESRRQNNFHFRLDAVVALYNLARWLRFELLACLLRKSERLRTDNA